MSTMMANNNNTTNNAPTTSKPPVDADELFMKLSVPELNVYERRTRYLPLDPAGTGACHHGYIERFMEQKKTKHSANCLSQLYFVKWFIRQDIENKKQELRMMVG